MPALKVRRIDLTANNAPQQLAKLREVQDRLRSRHPPGEETDARGLWRSADPRASGGSHLRRGPRGRPRSGLPVHRSVRQGEAEAGRAPRQGLGTRRGPRRGRSGVPRCAAAYPVQHRLVPVGLTAPRRRVAGVGFARTAHALSPVESRWHLLPRRRGGVPVHAVDDGGARASSRGSRDRRHAPAQEHRCVQPRHARGVPRTRRHRGLPHGWRPGHCGTGVRRGRRPPRGHGRRAGESVRRAREEVRLRHRRHRLHRRPERDHRRGRRLRSPELRGARLDRPGRTLARRGGPRDVVRTVVE